MCKENEIIQKDIKSISEWLNTSLDNLQIDYQIESMENYKNQAIEMLGTFDEFPKDERRMNKILKMLKNGEKPMPIYVEKDDPQLETFWALQDLNMAKITVVSRIGAESLAKIVFDHFNDVFSKTEGGRIRVYKVECFENKKNSAIYKRC